MFYSGETLLQMKLIKSGPAFPLPSLGEGGIQTLVSPGFESANLKCSVRCSFHFFISCILSYFPFVSKHIAPKIKINFSALEPLELEQCFSTLAESFTEYSIPLLFSWDVLSAQIFFFSPSSPHKMLYHKSERRVFSPVYVGLHEQEREEQGFYFRVLCLCCRIK